MRLETIFAFATEYKDALIALGVFFTAIIAFFGVVASAWITARSARRTHISSLREKWIAEQRTDLAKLLHLAAANVAWGAGETEEGSPLKAREIASRIRLRLTTGRKQPNPHDRLDDVVDRLRRALEGEERVDIDELCEKVVLHGKEVLKEAWEQSKRGK